jgi:iron complex transport system ATP-binding protein
MPDQAVISARDISVTIGKQTCLDSLSLKLFPGQVVGLMGPNGAGKTTLLKALTGELALSTGAIELQGKALLDWTLVERAKTVSVMPQYTRLDFDFSVADVVAMGRGPHDTGLIFDRQCINQVLDVCGLQALADKPYTQLSGGEQQRCQLARCLVQIERDTSSLNGCALLLDEPFNSIDIGYIDTIKCYLKTLSQRGLCIVISLHDANLLAQLSDRIFVLHKGQCVANACPEQVMKPELFESVFGVSVKVISHPTSQTPWAIPL